MEKFQEIMQRDGCELIVTPNAEIVLMADKDQELKRVIESASLVIADGIGLIYASRILRKPLPERLPGVEFLDGILKQLQENGQSVFFFGGKPGIAERAAQNAMRSYPDLKVAGCRDGYFRDEEEADIVEMINRSDADFLCIALGAPKQEKFINRHRAGLKVRGAIGVGGSFDVMAGEVKRAPAFFCNHGLEWLYRLLQQPSRYKRMMGLPVFMIKVLLTRR
jgi:N-acetylglucosaminyldiphosphoundecaprenol N-acetyl-beta-D-mannosaminyltransferase